MYNRPHIWVSERIAQERERHVMSIQQRRTPPSPNQETLDLLQHLIETPPATTNSWRAPVALRSTEEQRRVALHGYLFRTWIDRLLHHSERLLALAAILVFGYWVYDGPVRDWLHQPDPVPAASVAAAPAKPATLPTVYPATEPEPETIERAPLPFTTPDMGERPEQDDFLAPRPALVEQETIQVPQPHRLQIPALALDTPVKEVFVVDGAWEVADYAAGYMHGTALPGEAGTLAMAGHAGLRGGVFANLGSLAAGNDVLIDAAGWRYRYRVRESLNVWPTQTEVLAPSEQPTLVLITCTNWDTQRLIVIADLVESKPITGA